MSTTGQINLRASGFDCQSAQEEFRDYLEGDLRVKEARLLEEHLAACPRCQKALQEHKRMFKLMNNTIGAGPLNEGFVQRAEAKLKNTPDAVPLPNPKALPRTPAPITGEYGEVTEEDEELFAPAPNGFLDTIGQRFGAAPWWMISGAFHALLLLLLTLVGMALLRAQEDNLVIVTDLERRQEPPPEVEQKPRDVFKQIVPTDTSEVVVEQPVVVHEEIEIAEHVETANESDAADTRGEDGMSDVFLGGTGSVAAIGLGGGGGGAFGRPNGAGGRLRRAMMGGGGKATESAVDKALEWLARHQEQDGSWNAMKHEGKADARVEGLNGDVAVTGFALLAFLGAGHTERVGKYKDHVRRGTEWLVKTLEEQEKKVGEGRWLVNHGSNYTQGVAALALAEAAAMGRNPKVKEAAQRATDGVVKGQIKLDESSYAAWDYAPGQRTCDTSITGWNIMALKSAKVAGLHIDPAAFEGAMKWINAGQDLNGAPQGDAEYWDGGMMTYRGTLDAPNGRKNMAMTAAAALTRMMIGGEKMDSPGIAGPCNLMKKDENLPTPNADRFNLYYWYYGTLVCFQKGGEHWNLWNEKMKTALLPTQRKDGDFDGSWDPYFTEPTGYIYGGRVQSTALGALCLEVYYRYLPIHR
ncbi:MAG: zf-HC2 domain-containing protein [Planctomycetota bacterium]|nr:zf-HC2 domain-containing protein [Planctomycetota bacterium]